MLDRIRGIRDACDLDLLLFFRRHPHALLASEQLVAYLGYDRQRIEKSLEGLIGAGLLTRSRNLSNTAYLYVLELHDLPGALLPSLLKIARTREGRQSALRLLKTGPDRVPGAGIRPPPRVSRRIQN